MNANFFNRTVFLTTLMATSMGFACGGEIAEPVGHNSDNLEAGVGMTLNTVGDVVTVQIEGDIIHKVDFFLDAETTAFASDNTSPFTATLSTTGLSAGEHHVRALIEIDVMGDVSTITRTKMFSLSVDGGPAPTTGEFPLVTELEDFSVTSSFEVQNDSAASEGAALVHPNGVTNTTDPGVEASYEFSVSEAGTYRFYLRILAPSSASDAFYAGLNGVLNRRFPSAPSTDYQWLLAVEQTLPAGAHTLSVGRGESGIRLDAAVVSRETLNSAEMDALVGVDGSATPEPEPSTREFSLVGNPNFSESSLDDTQKDDLGVTLRGWYQRFLTTATAGTYDGSFDRARNRSANRTGAMYVTSLLTGLRLTGDMRLLDEAVGLVNMWYSHLTEDEYGYLHHADPDYDQTLDVSLSAGIFARVMYAAHVNRHLKSPNGHNYGAIADKFKDYLTDHYFPRWRKKGKAGPDLHWGASSFRHSYAQTMAVWHYVAKMGGGGGYTQAEWEAAAKKGFDLFFSADRVCATGLNGRETLVMPFNCDADTQTTSGAAMLYSTYMRYMIVFSLDFFLDGADPRFNDTWFKRLSHSLADFMIDEQTEEDGTLGRTIAGDSPSTSERCGVPYIHEYRGRASASKWMISGWMHLEGWESTGKITAHNKRMYERASSSTRNDYPYFALTQVLGRIYHGK